MDILTIGVIVLIALLAGAYLMLQKKGKGGQPEQPKAEEPMKMEEDIFPSEPETDMDSESDIESEKKEM